MPDLEAQIRRMADAAETATDSQQLLASKHRKPRYRVMAAAAAIVVLVCGVFAWTQRDTSERPIVVAVGGTEVAELLPVGGVPMVDLTKFEQEANGERIAAIGPLLSIDFAALGPEWEVDEYLVGTTLGSDEGQYHQQVEATRADGTSLVIVTTGRLDGQPMTIQNTYDGEQIEIRGQVGYTTPGRISWVEQGLLNVTVLGAPIDPPGDVDSEIRKLAEQLNAVVAPLNWTQTVEDLQTYTGIDEPFLQGRLGDLEWQLLSSVAGKDILVLVADGHQISKFPWSTSLRPDEAAPGIQIRGVPGGMLVFGEVPTHVEGIDLVAKSGIVRLPVASHISGLRAFAVSVADVVDPMRLDFLGQGGQFLDSYSLDAYPPFIFGSYVAGFVLDSENPAGPTDDDDQEELANPADTSIRSSLDALQAVYVNTKRNANDFGAVCMSERGFPQLAEASAMPEQSEMFGDGFALPDRLLQIDPLMFGPYTVEQAQELGINGTRIALVYGHPTPGKVASNDPSYDAARDECHDEYSETVGEMSETVQALQGTYIDLVDALQSDFVEALDGRHVQLNVERYECLAESKYPTLDPAGAITGDILELLESVNVAPGVHDDGATDQTQQTVPEGSVIVLPSSPLLTYTPSEAEVDFAMDFVECGTLIDYSNRLEQLLGTAEAEILAEHQPAISALMEEFDGLVLP